MKGLLFTDKFAPHFGGTAIIFYNWTKHIPNGQLSIVTCTVPGQNHRVVDGGLKARVYRVPFINIPKLRMPLCWLMMFLLSPIAMLMQRPDVIHAGQPLETGWIAWFCSRLFGKPYILHCFGDDIPLYWHSRWVGGIMRFIARRADRITVISKYSAAKLRELGISPDKISLIYPGAEHDVQNDPLQTPNTTGANQRCFKGKPTLLTVGRLIERKGHDRVIEAMPHIVSRIPGVEYVIVGAGSEERRLRDLAGSHGVASAVTFVGGVPHDAVSTYYRNADVFVHPNRELANGEVEGFGMVFIEASAFGVPVIGGNTGGTPDAILDGKTGFLVDPNSVEEIAERVIQLMSDHSLHQNMSEAGRAWAAGFTWEKAASELCAISECAAKRTTVDSKSSA